MARAHYLVAKAIKSGELVRPDTCDVCGKSPNPAKNGRTQIQAHHHRGYDNPLDVQWVCQLCHKDVANPDGIKHPADVDPLGSILDD
jgi:hypothetical protein